MRINISARHIELTKSLAEYVQKKVEKCQKYFDHLVWAQVILSVEKYRQVAEVVIHAGKMTFRAKEESIDLYAAIDLSLDKMEKQLHKYKEKMKNTHKVKMAEASIINHKFNDKYGEDIKLISENRRYDIKEMTIREAIDGMESMGDKFYMFLNTETSQINVVYHKDANSYGLLEPKL